MRQPARKPERRVLLVLMMAAGVLWLLVEILDQLDSAILFAFRRGADPIGPKWVEELARDITALGSFAVLALLIGASVIFLLMAKQTRDAWTMLGSAAGGIALTLALKALLERPRPELFLQMVHVSTASFPSGHAMMSAVTYLTLGAFLARELPSRRLKRYVMVLALVVSLLVGLSRIYLGVHWPSDVLAGWCFGATWALMCWSFAERAEKQ